MKTYDCPRDLEQWGFRCLTGEACGLGLRLLYDMNGEGQAILARTIGLTSDQLKLAPPWNGGDFDAGSALLTHDQSLMCALLGMLLWNKCVCVVQPYDKCGHAEQRLYGFEDEAEEAVFKETRIGFPVGTEFRIHRLSSMPGSGDRNQHMMSGRIN